MHNQGELKKLVIRKIIKIDDTLCNGCGKCLPNCAEGAIQIINKKAKIVKDSYCDGLGACLGHCPQGALKIVVREADKFDKESVKLHLREKNKKEHKNQKTITQWPIQLNLISPNANFLKNSDILLSADCVPATYPDFHKKLLSKNKILLGCPKFDNPINYAKKMEQIIKNNNIKTITVVHMEVPCCSGLKWIAKKAVEESGKKISIKNIMIGINGEIK
ncbi:MAG: hypothetical protein AC479_03860 [miscellaneous Crenarchaeota group-6 archaeon AD8-1]|nr:MAG: hypothetical protein AC479_03860 [miscellaneous Crenarchaeota group-6 archaeon AD8-1]